MGRTVEPASIPLIASFSEPRLESYLENEIAMRYDQPPLPPIPVVGTVNFQPGGQGTELDIDRSVDLIDSALRSPSKRVVDLPLSRTNPPRPSIGNLEIMLKQIVDIAEFEGLVGLYLSDLQTGEEINFAYSQGQDFSTNPDVAFTAASIIKIPIMVSAFRRLDENPDSETTRLIEEMIEKSGNDPADWLMERVIDPFTGPLGVTDDMRALGLENTFLGRAVLPGRTPAGSFSNPCQPAHRYQHRPGYLQPDHTLRYRHADGGYLPVHPTRREGNLLAIFPDEFTQEECQAMINILGNNDIGLLIEAGVPDGTPVAHKHGWVTYFGVMNTLGDAGIVYTPGGNYVLSIFIHHPDQLIWDPASELVAVISEAIYNYFNQVSG